jgi:hypothetical protein
MLRNADASTSAKAGKSNSKYGIGAPGACCQHRRIVVQLDEWPSAASSQQLCSGVEVEACHCCALAGPGGQHLQHAPHLCVLHVLPFVMH